MAKITNTCLMAYSWYKTCPVSWKDKALKNLKQVLSGQFNANEATERGNRFEDKVEVLRVAGEKFDGVLKPLNVLEGFQSQCWIKPLTLRVNDIDFVFRGKVDYIGTLIKNKKGLPAELKPYAGEKIIVDIKTTGAKEIKENKYTDSWQHAIYCLAEEVDVFSYFVFQFADETSIEPKSLKIFTIDMREELFSRKKDLEKTIAEFVDFLKAFNLWDTYVNKFCGGRL